MASLLGGCFLLFLSFACVNGQSVLGEVTRRTNYGIVRGVRTDLSQKFLGIPFAKPPGRWESPVDPVTWSGVYQATQAKPMCYQTPNCAEKNPVGTCLPEMSEDCLYLNIFAPARSDTDLKRAVMVFLHGGGFEFSSGGADLYNGEMIAAKGGVIVVTINYRLGAFGFMVTGSGPSDIRGNYGLQDQRQALKWVNENIHHFGGDASRVTLFGQSAGGISAIIHMTSGKADQYFNYVILESSPITIPLKPLQVAIQQGDQFTRMLNCAPRDTQCLKSRPADFIARTQGQFFMAIAYPDSFLRKFTPWVPHVDGVEVPMDISDAIRTGRLTAKPAILGSVSEEGQMYINMGFHKPVNSVEYRLILMGLEPKLATGAYNMYPPTNTSDARSRMSEVTTDFVFTCPTRQLARTLGKRAPVYTYLFHNNISIDGVWNRLDHCIDRVCHGVELPFVFQSARIPPYTLNPAETRLSNSIIRYWTNFAKTGNPNDQYWMMGSQFWPRYTVDGNFPEMSIVLTAGQSGVFLTQSFKNDKCNFWDNSDYRAKK